MNSEMIIQIQVALSYMKYFCKISYTLNVIRLHELVNLLDILLSILLRLKQIANL